MRNGPSQASAVRCPEYPQGEHRFHPLQLHNHGIWSKESCLSCSRKQLFEPLACRLLVGFLDRFRCDVGFYRFAVPQSILKLFMLRETTKLSMEWSWLLQSYSGISPENEIFMMLLLHSLPYQTDPVSHHCHFSTIFGSSLLPIVGCGHYCLYSSVCLWEIESINEGEGWIVPCLAEVRRQVYQICCWELEDLADLCQTVLVVMEALLLHQLHQGVLQAEAMHSTWMIFQVSAEAPRADLLEMLQVMV